MSEYRWRIRINGTRPHPGRLGRRFTRDRANEQHGCEHRNQRVRLQTQRGNAGHHTDVNSKTSAAGERRT